MPLCSHFSPGSQVYSYPPWKTSSVLQPSHSLPFIREVLGSNTGNFYLYLALLVISAASLWFPSPSPAFVQVWCFQTGALERPPAVYCQCIEITILVLLSAPALIFYLFVSTPALILSMSPMINNFISSICSFSGLDLSSLCVVLTTTTEVSVAATFTIK